MISRETDITAKMRASKNAPSMQELCEIYKKKRELMWKLNDGSELDEHPRYRRMLARLSTVSVSTTVEQRTNAIDTGADRPLCSTKTRRSTMKVYDTDDFLSNGNDNLEGYVTVRRRNDLRFSHVGKEFSECVDSESFSEDEYGPNTVEETNLTRTAPQQRQKMRMEGKQEKATNLYRHPAYEEMRPPRKDEGRMYMNERTRERRRRDAHCCLQVV